MQQPQLGRKIAQIRKQRNLTQEELVAQCNVSVRTIQRIEAGEVSPRISTIKIILAALGTSIEEVYQKEDAGSRRIWDFLSVGSSEKNKEITAILQIAWIAGIIYLVLGLIDAGMDYLHMSGEMDRSNRLFFALTKLIVLSSYTLFMRGFVLLADLFDQYLLKVSSYMMVAAFLLITTLDIYDIFWPLPDELFMAVQVGASLTVGAIGIVLGLALWRLQDGMGKIAAVAGGLELVIGVCFLTVVFFFLSFILLIPATIVEVVLLFKANEFIAREKEASIYDF